MQLGYQWVRRVRNLCPWLKGAGRKKGRCSGAWGLKKPRWQGSVTIDIWGQTRSEGCGGVREITLIRAWWLSQGMCSCHHRTSHEAGRTYHQEWQYRLNFLLLPECLQQELLGKSTMVLNVGMLQVPVHSSRPFLKGYLCSLGQDLSPVLFTIFVAVSQWVYLPWVNISSLHPRFPFLK